MDRPATVGRRGKDRPSNVCEMTLAPDWIDILPHNPQAVPVKNTFFQPQLSSCMSINQGIARKLTGVMDFGVSVDFGCIFMHFEAFFIETDSFGD